MPYGLILLVSSLILCGLYLFTEAAVWSKVLVMGLLLVSLVCSGYLIHFHIYLGLPLFGLVLRLVLCLFILSYLKAYS